MLASPRKRKHHPPRPSMIATLLLSLFALCSTSISSSRPDELIPPEIPLVPPRIPQENSKSVQGHHEFSLRHIFHRGTYQNPNLHRRLDIKPGTTLWVTSEDGLKLPAPRLLATSRPVRIQRLADRRAAVIEDHLSMARLTGSAPLLSEEAWTMDDLAGPNTSDKKTVLSLAQMAANAYIMEPGTEDWSDVKGPFNHSQSFGWEGDGLRGHIYADDSNSTIVIAMKGTSPALFDGEETTTNDKLNDNLFFSCCCAQGGHYFWRQVCDCYSTTYTCNSTCLVEALRSENRYYRAAIDLYTNVTELYPTSDVWLAGHSLGGSVSSLLGMTFGLPVTTFEAVPEALPASRLGLPAPPGTDPKAPQSRDYTGAYHFGHTADPVYMGTCNGAASVCTLGGYAMESMCHTGQRCVYDTVQDLGWRVGIGTHRIRTTIDVIEKYETVPECLHEKDCFECPNWKYFKSNGSDSTTTRTTTSSSTTSTTRTRTSTCKTPGWWGCLDKTTTVATTTSTSETTTTTKCKTPGWFGCKDPTTTTTTSTAPASRPPSVTSTTSQTTSSTTCKHPGWFGGCNDPTGTTGTATSTRSALSSQSGKPCKTPGYFWGCRDRHSKTSSSSHTTTQTPPPSSGRQT